MKTSISLHFRNSTRMGHHPGVLFIRIIRHRKACEFTLADCLLYPHEWSTRLGQIILPESDPFRARQLAAMQQQAVEAIRHLREEDQRLALMGEYSVTDLLYAYRLKRKNTTLGAFSENLARKLEESQQWRTARAYRTVCRGLLGFARRSDIPLSELNAALFMAFEHDLKNRRRQANTISYYMRNLRAIYNKAVRHGLIVRPAENPFFGVFTGVARTAKRALDIKGVKAIINETRGEPADLSRARRYFAFCFYARGMCFVDMAHLRKSDIHGDMLCYQRRKTGRKIELKLTPPLRAIIKSFSSETADSPHLFPIIIPGASARRCYDNALRRQNYHLKRLASLAGLNAPVSTHWARHSWATIGKRAHIPTAVLSECLGHSSEQVTRIYLDSFEHGVLDRANQRIGRLVPYTGYLRV